MSIFILIANRAIKFFGNICKVLCYPFHWCFPNKRFTIPRHARAVFSSKKCHDIPNILWQTNYTNRVSLPVYLNYLFNRLMSLGYEYRYVSDEESLSFVKTRATEQEYCAYTKLKDGAAKADLWRMLVLKYYGGVYMDIDAHLVWPLRRLIKLDDKELYILQRKKVYTNYFLASIKNNIHIEQIVKNIVRNIELAYVNKNHPSLNTYVLTGPPFMQEVLEDKKSNTRSYRHVCLQGTFTNEFFQYIDKKNGKWTRAKPEDILM